MPSVTPHQFQAVLGGATFFPRSDNFFIGVAGTVARFSFDLDEDGTSIAEELAPSTYVAIWGAGDLSVSGTTMSGSLSGTFEYCASPSAASGNFYRCPIEPERCWSRNHRLTLVPR
jgi:hypothetical protein